MKRGCLDLGTHVLEAMLQLPLEWKIIDGEWDAGRKCFVVFVEGEGLPECPEGVFPMGLVPTCTMGHQVSGLTATRITWPVIE